MVYTYLGTLLKLNEDTAARPTRLEDEEVAPGSHSDLAVDYGPAAKAFAFSGLADEEDGQSARLAVNEGVDARLVPILLALLSPCSYLFLSMLRTVKCHTVVLIVICCCLYLALKMGG